MQHHCGAFPPLAWRRKTMPMYLVVNITQHLCRQRPRPYNRLSDNVTKPTKSEIIDVTHCKRESSTLSANRRDFAIPAFCEL